MKNNLSKRILSIFLAIAFVVGVPFATAFAEDYEVSNEYTSVYEEATEEAQVGGGYEYVTDESNEEVEENENNEEENDEEVKENENNEEENNEEESNKEVEQNYENEAYEEVKEEVYEEPVVVVSNNLGFQNINPFMETAPHWVVDSQPVMVPEGQDWVEFTVRLYWADMEMQAIDAIGLVTQTEYGDFRIPPAPNTSRLGTGVSGFIIHDVMNVGEITRTQHSVEGMSGFEGVPTIIVRKYIEDGTIPNGGDQVEIELGRTPQFQTPMTWSYVILERVGDSRTFDVAYSFVSGTEGETLPATVTALATATRTGIANGAVVTPTAPAETTVAVENGTWTFVGWNYDTHTIAGAGFTFVGTWTFEETETFEVTYSFVSGTEDMVLPQAVLSRIPATRRVLDEAEVTPTAIIPPTVTVAGGTWTFVGWDYELIVVDGEDISFEGTWTFAAAPIVNIPPIPGPDRRPFDPGPEPWTPGVPPINEAPPSVEPHELTRPVQNWHGVGTAVTETQPIVQGESVVVEIPTVVAVEGYQADDVITARVNPQTSDNNNIAGLMVSVFGLAVSAAAIFFARRRFVDKIN